MNLEKFFNPRSVAVVGASAEEHKVGYALMHNLLAKPVRSREDSQRAPASNGADKSRKIYPVNPASANVFDETSYKSVRDIPDVPDMAVIAVRAEFVPKVVEECGKKRIPFVVVISAGFKETGARGAELEAKIIRLARRYDISLLGPNCLGVINAQANLNATFANEKHLPGKIAFVSQSGAMGTAILDWALAERIGFSKFVSLGNESGLAENDFLEYLARDKDTEAILLYLEKISDGEKFIKLAKKITPEKPVVLLKAGRSGRGAEAALSHTGSLAPAGDILSSACKEAGIVEVDDIRDIFDLAKLFHMGIVRPLRRIAVVTNAGGPGVVATDLIDLSKTLELAEFSARTLTELKRLLPPMTTARDPLDVVGDARSDRYEAALKSITAEKKVDAVLVILTPQMMTQPVETARVIARYAARKKMLPVFLGGKAVEPGIKALREEGLANFDFPEDAITALDALTVRGVRKEKAAPKAHAHAKPMRFRELLPLLARYGIPMRGSFIAKKQGLATVMRKTKGRPMAMKIVSTDIIHKSEAGGVALDIETLEEAERAREAMAKAARKRRAKLEGVFIEPMAKGYEVIVGMKRDPVFGPVVVFGMGGIFAEALRDVAMRVAPVSPKDAEEMLHEIKGAMILEGARGKKAADKRLLVKIIVAVSKLALANKKIAEVDLNPVIVNNKGAVIADARIMMQP